MWEQFSGLLFGEGSRSLSGSAAWQGTEKEQRDRWFDMDKRLSFGGEETGGHGPTPRLTRRAERRRLSEDGEPPRVS